MIRTAVDLFSGIGGFALACEWAGVETIAFAEIDDYASRVLSKRFPGVRNYGDVRTLPAIDGAWLLCGGPPCQPASSAGRRQGAADDRWLWPETLAAVAKFAPEWCLFENPTGILSLNDGLEFENICLALEGEGYEVQPIVIPACAVNALHRRDRVWICAHSERGSRGAEHGQQQDERASVVDRVRSITSDSERSGRREQLRANAERQSLHTTVREESASGLGSSGEIIADPALELSYRGGPSRTDGWTKLANINQPNPLSEPDGEGREVERDFRGIPHGVSRRVDRLRTLGNAIVPQVAYQFIKRMIEAEAA